MGVTAQSIDDAQFEAAVADVRRLPADHPERGLRAANLIGVLLQRPLDSSHHLLRHVDELLAAADRDPPPAARWTQIRRVARAMSLMYAVAEGPSARLDAVESELGSLAGQATGDPAMAAVVSYTQMALMFRKATEQGNESMLQRLPEMVTGMTSPAPGNPAIAQLQEIISFGAEALAANQRGETATAMDQMSRVQEAVKGLPDGPLRNLMDQATAPATMLRQLFDESGSPRPGGATADQLAALGALAGDPKADPMLSGLAAGAGFLGLGNETDPVKIDRGIASFRQALAQTPPEHPQYPFCLQSVALALFRRSEVTATTEGLAEARALLEQARDLLGGPQHPQWSFVHDMLSAIRQRIGDHAGVRESGLAGQRGYAWRVLLETDAAGARIAVRSAAQDAVDIARRCLAGGDPADALRALDGGRGLMLFAAMELHRIPARREAAGHPDLAREWSQQRTRSDALRQKVLEVLTRHSPAGLFDPPALPEIQAALALLEADALVYLVPGDQTHGGMAVMAPAVGPPAFMALPFLSLDEGTDVERYLSALSTRDVSTTDTTGFADRLEALCDWAWRAAIGPLLESYVPRLTARPPDRIPRIMLIPMGDLARVPWHAARNREGVYAVQLAAISQAVSARLLCDNAVLAPVSIGSAGMVVADPDSGARAASLRSARIEAHAVRRAFYRGARYLGRLPDDRVSASGAGTAEEVRAWLANQSPSAGTMLHLACHGYFRAGPDAVAHLLLAGDSELSLHELVDLLAGVPGRAIALVVLAACNTGRTVYGYDEAYSLGTGFLAGGARSVLSTQWSVPDTATSWLMFLFHRYLRHDGLPPWQALRQAQMWMLDPAREVPHDMPPELIPGPDDDPAGVLNWAGFVHYGQ